MILVVAAVLPVVCLCGLTLYRLSNTAHIRNEASEARDTAHNFIYMANTVQALQVIRVVILKVTVVVVIVELVRGIIHESL